MNPPINALASPDIIPEQDPNIYVKLYGIYIIGKPRTNP